MASGGGRLATASTLHPRLQDQNRRHLINNLPSSLNRHVGFAQKPVGLGRRQAFIPQVDRDMQALVQFVGETPHFFRLSAFRPAHPQGKPDHDLGDTIFARQLLELLEIKTLVLSLEGRKALVTGASKGIGFEICRVLADAGADIVAVARDAGWPRSGRRWRARGGAAS